jgi:hypothetical protein
MGLLGQRDPRWYVVYPDGKRSEMMDKHVAKGYADHFGGTVIGPERWYDIIIYWIKELKWRKWFWNRKRPS